MTRFVFVTLVSNLYVVHRILLHEHVCTRTVACKRRTLRHLPGSRPGLPCLQIPRSVLKHVPFRKPAIEVTLLPVACCYWLHPSQVKSLVLAIAILVL